MFKVFEKNVVVLFLALFHVFKSMEPLSFNSPAEIDEIRRLPRSTKVFVSSSARNRTRILTYESTKMFADESRRISKNGGKTV